MHQGRRGITRTSAFVATLPERSPIATETGDPQVLFIGHSPEDSRDREHIRLALTVQPKKE